MADINKAAAVEAEELYYEDEFGVGLKIFLGARIVYYIIGLFLILGALLCVVLGLTNLDDLVSNATGYNATFVDANFGGYQICMYVQALYTIASLVVTSLFFVKRSKLLAFIDLGLFVVLIATVIAMGAFDLFTNKSAWIVYAVINPLWSFIALFAGKHFKYMPLK